ncbi:hypothetical protein BpHYR1_008972 [Brachionus plicatilis]|uniref:Uncharacterized protein n=1 Tax=Brachionus plicatilis TaxID=10195 RepID=A0A3M7RWW9_BRAPC|nr:hypothetical protein BpHYR1_008972 [Brachionus plicatilis]
MITNFVITSIFLTQYFTYQMKILRTDLAFNYMLVDQLMLCFFVVVVILQSSLNNRMCLGGENGHQIITDRRYKFDPS